MMLQALPGVGLGLDLDFLGPGRSFELPALLASKRNMSLPVPPGVVHLQPMLRCPFNRSCMLKGTILQATAAMQPRHGVDSWG